MLVYLFAYTDLRSNLSCLSKATHSTPKDHAPVYDQIPIIGAGRLLVHQQEPKHGLADHVNPSRRLVDGGVEMDDAAMAIWPDAQMVRDRLLATGIQTQDGALQRVSSVHSDALALSQDQTVGAHALEFPHADRPTGVLNLKVVGTPQLQEL